MLIVTVLKEGPEYGAEQARWIHRQLVDYDAACLTDLPRLPGIGIAPLKRAWPSWWAKMELFDPRGPFGYEDLFYLDVDTLVLRDLAPLIEAASKVDDLVMLSDFYHGQFHPRRLASGVMWIPASAKERIWRYWIQEPQEHMRKTRVFGEHGDQGVIAAAASDGVKTWKELTPGSIMSYKRDFATPSMPGYSLRRSRGNGAISREAVLMCFHGNPRPWNVPFFRDPLQARDELFRARRTFSTVRVSCRNVATEP